MPYTRRRTWPNSDREDYVIRCEGLDVGGVYLARVPEGERWLWTIYINGHVPQVEGVPISGLAPDLDAAAAQFKASYERMRAKGGLPTPRRTVGAGGLGPAELPRHPSLPYSARV